ncbi:unnamed protein product [Rhodiola kirilowii]
MSIKEGQSTTRLVLLEGHNYGYSKARMKEIIKNVDEKAWRSVLTGGNPPLFATDEGLCINQRQNGLNRRSVSPWGMLKL